MAKDILWMPFHRICFYLLLLLFPDGEEMKSVSTSVFFYLPKNCLLVRM